MDLQTRIGAASADEQRLQDGQRPDQIEAGDGRIGRQTQLHALEEFLRTVVAAHDVHCQAHKQNAPVRQKRTRRV
jgi:hypothetical protein